uniref:Uncharacterized protein n=1 Tax=Haemonchus contortus TaxID=6289 RepID=W6NCG5_HAECO
MPSAAIDEGPSERNLSNKDESKEDVQQHEESPRPAHAERDAGYSQKEKFLFSLTAILPILAVASFIGIYDMTLASIIFAIAASVVLAIGVVGICTKNSTCMLISIILLIILVVAKIVIQSYRLYSIFTSQKGNLEAHKEFVHGLIVCIALVVSIIVMCFLRREL